MKDIIGYEGLYAATLDGRIWSYPKKRGEQNRKGKFLKPFIIKTGYKVVSLFKEGEKDKKFLVHRLVAITHIPNIKEFDEVNHIDADKFNNSVDNLEWVTSKQNKKHAWELNLYSKNAGENHYLSKLTDTEVKKIRYIFKTSEISQAQIARDFKVSPMLISLIVRNKAWKHVV